MANRFRPPLVVVLIGLLLGLQSVQSRYERVRTQSLHLREVNTLKVWCWMAATQSRNPE